ncbi:MAG: type VI secretion system membrane subunit TssM [Stellaceae bacterium]
MGRFFRFLGTRWFITLIGAIALSLLIWFLGPLLAFGGNHFLGSDAVRLVVVMIILVAWGVINIVSWHKASKTNDEMVKALTETPEDANAAESTAEIAALRKRLEEALILLRRSSGAKGRRRGPRYLYELPWYMFIGPPGSGKTTALRNSGLNFPTAEKFGSSSVTGVGGTRNCDWLLTDQAVLLDTAGRYTTQDSNTAVDQGAWKGFLELLKRYRPRQPINGALVAMGISDIALLSPEERSAHARAIRKRLLELRDEFDVRFPIYFLLTKADLMAGFVEFFDDIGREDREQVWGVTLPFDSGEETAEPAIANIGGEFDALVQRLGDRVLERLQRETDVLKRAQIFGFPTQVASIKEPLLQFLNEIFVPNRYEGRLLLRGVYFTSGTQEGTPFDRLMGAMAASFGVERQRLPSFSGSGRSYFLGRLFRDVIFGEANVVSANPKLERRQKLIRRFAYGAIAVVFLGLTAAWTVSYFGNQQLIATVERRIDVYRKLVAPFTAGTVDDANVRATVPVLTDLRDFPVGYADRDKGEPLLLDFGLYQGAKLGAEAQVAYDDALNKIFLPRLLIRLGHHIDTHLTRLDVVEEDLRVYLMLGGEGPMNTGEIRSWMVRDWAKTYPGSADQGLRQSLVDHLDAMLAQPLQQIALDGRVIGEARQALERQPLAQRVYSEIKSKAADGSVGDWRIVDNAGPNADRVIALKSGKPLTSGVPGLYTKKGYYEEFLPQLTLTAHQAAKESWVMGKSGQGGGSSGLGSGQIEKDVVALYTADYEAQWDRLLGDIEVRPFTEMTEASDVLNILSAPDSPLKLLLVAIASQTDLSKPPGAKTANAAGNLSRAVSPTTAYATRRIAAIASAAGSFNSTLGPSYGQLITEHFRNLRRFVGLGISGPAPVDDMLHDFNSLYMQATQMVAPGQAPGNAFVADSGASARLASEAARLPAPANNLVAAVAANFSGLTRGHTRSQLNDLWRAQVLPFCERALSGRYPFHHDSQTGVTLEDFGHLFAPGGLIDSFFKTNLAPYVDYSHKPWRWQAGRTVNLGLSNSSLIEFQRAATIRDGFFGGGGSTPSLRLQFTPVSLDAGSTEVIFDLDGQQLTYAHGPPQSQILQWPGKGGFAEGRVVFQTSSGLPATITVSGPWSLFRLLDRARIRRTGADRLRVTFTAGGHEAIYDVQTASVINPLSMNDLRAFRCPSHL